MAVTRESSPASSCHNGSEARDQARETFPHAPRDGRASDVPFEEGALVQGALFRFAQCGALLRHPSTLPQILAVLDGSGAVSGAAGTEEPIEAGEAVFSEEGEDHEMKSAHELTALIIEGQHLDRFRGRPAAAS
jgi:quercetin dioxygenase-like cupin family protein